MQATQHPIHSSANYLASTSDADSDLGYGQLFSAVWRRRFWFGGVLAFSVIMAGLYTAFSEPSYVSTLQLLVESNYQSKNQTRIKDEFTDDNIEIDDSTQINLMGSSQLLRQAMQSLSDRYPEFNPESPKALKEFRKAIKIGQLGQRSVENKNVATKIFEVTYVDSDPIRTREVLKALQDVYTQYNREQQALRLKRALKFIESQLPSVQEKVKAAETDLEALRVKTGIIDPELQAQSQIGSLNELQQQLQINAAELSHLYSTYTTLSIQLPLPPEEAILNSRLSQSARYQKLLSEIQQTELELSQQRIRFTDESPQVQQFLEKRQRQLQMLAVESDRVLGAAGGETHSPSLRSGQLGQTDIEVINAWVDSGIKLNAARARYQSLQASYQSLTADISRLPKLLTTFNRLSPEISTNRETLQELLKARQDLQLEIEKGGFEWQVVEEPQVGLKLGPSLPKNLLLGGVVGVMLGGIAAFAREASDDALHTSEDLRRQVQVPLLGLVPTLPVISPDFDDQPLFQLPFRKVALRENVQTFYQQGFRESLDLLYQNIQLLQQQQPLKSLVMTSALAGEGKSTLALGLAMSAARLHQRVLLIDADLRRPSLHKLLNIPNERGLSNFLLEGGRLPPGLLPSAAQEQSGIAVLTAGPTPADPAKLLSSRRMREAIALFEQHYDLVIVDAPPVNGMVDTLLMGSCCQGVLMVGRMNRVTKVVLNQALVNLKSLNVIGVVANDVAMSQTVYGAV